MIGDSRLLPFRHRIDIFSYNHMKKRYLWKGSIIEQQIYQQQIRFFYTSNSNFYWQKKVKFLTDSAPPTTVPLFYDIEHELRQHPPFSKRKKMTSIFLAFDYCFSFLLFTIFLVLSFSIIIIDISIITSIYKFCCCWLIRTFMFIKWQLQYENFKLRRACGIFCMNVCE